MDRYIWLAKLSRHFGIWNMIGWNQREEYVMNWILIGLGSQKFICEMWNLTHWRTRLTIKCLDQADRTSYRKVVPLSCTISVLSWISCSFCHVVSMYALSGLRVDQSDSFLFFTFSYHPRGLKSCEQYSSLYLRLPFYRFTKTIKFCWGKFFCSVAFLEGTQVKTWLSKFYARLDLNSRTWWVCYVH